LSLAAANFLAFLALPWARGIKLVGTYHLYTGSDLTPFSFKLKESYMLWLYCWKVMLITLQIC